MEDIVERAIQHIEEKAREYRIDNAPAFLDPHTVSNYAKLQLGQEKHEVFMVLYLNNQHELIRCVKEFRGTIDGASVYPRVIAAHALEYNAAAVVFAHNHPSGVATPSTADQRITERLKSALSLLDIRVLDHVIVCLEGGHLSTVSFAEQGLI